MTIGDLLMNLSCYHFPQTPSTHSFLLFPPFFPNNSIYESIENTLLWSCSFYSYRLVVDSCKCTLLFRALWYCHGLCRWLRYEAPLAQLSLRGVVRKQAENALGLQVTGDKRTGVQALPTTLVIQSFGFSFSQVVGRCHTPSVSASAYPLSRSFIWFPIGWRPFTFSIQSGHVLRSLPLSLLCTFSLACSFRTRSLQSFSNWNFSMVLIAKRAGCEATPETHFDARALRLPQENADACRKLVKQNISKITSKVFKMVQ